MEVVYEDGSGGDITPWFSMNDPAGLARRGSGRTAQLKAKLHEGSRVELGCAS